MKLRSFQLAGLPSSLTKLRSKLQDQSFLIRRAPLLWADENLYPSLSSLDHTKMPRGVQSGGGNHGRQPLPYVYPPSPPPPPCRSLTTTADGEREREAGIERGSLARSLGFTRFLPIDLVFSVVVNQICGSLVSSLSEWGESHLLLLPYWRMEV